MKKNLIFVLVWLRVGAGRYMWCLLIVQKNKEKLMRSVNLIKVSDESNPAAISAHPG